MKLLIKHTHKKTRVLEGKVILVNDRIEMEKGTVNLKVLINFEKSD